MATTDGTSRPPSEEGMTAGSPPSMMATTELVVPRSIPIILPIVFISCTSGDSDKRRPQNTLFENIALLNHVDHATVIDLMVLLVAERFVEVGVKAFADGLDRLDAFGFEQRRQFAVDQLDAFGPGLPVAFRLTVLQRPLEVVLHGEIPCEDAAGSAGVALLLISLIALLIVRELSPRPLPAIQVFFCLVLGLLQQGHHRFGVLSFNLFGRLRFDQIVFSRGGQSFPDRRE